MSRLFVAVRPPQGIVEELRERLEPIASDPPAGLRMTPSGQWHVTLRFIGDADPAEVAGRLEGARFPECEARISNGPTLMGRVVVFGVEGLDPLALAVASATDGVGNEPGERGFRGHLTVARLRRNAGVTGVRSRLASLGGRTHDVRIRWRPACVELVSSVTEPSGAVHEVLATYPNPSEPRVGCQRRR